VTVNHDFMQHNRNINTCVAVCVVCHLMVQSLNTRRRPLVVNARSKLEPFVLFILVCLAMLSVCRR
jgi:hypothetical protein